MEARQSIQPGASKAMAVLHIHGEDEALHEVPGELLCQLIGSLQRMIDLVAAGKSGQGGRKRISGSNSLNYRIVCLVPASGGFELPFFVKNEAIPLADNSKDILAAMLLSISAIASGDISGTALSGLSRYNLAHFANAVATFAPDPARRWNATIDIPRSAAPIKGVPSVLCFSGELARKAREILDSPEEAPEEVMSVIGELVSVNFETYSLVLRHNSTHKEIKCSCRPEAIDQVLQDRRGGVQVTGRFILDESGDPKELTDVSSVVAVDLSQMEFPSFLAFNGGTIRRKPDANVSFTPALDEDARQVFIAERPDLGICAFGQTREGLVDDIREQLAVNWREYALEEDSRLTEAARSIKRAMLAAYTGEGAAYAKAWQSC